MRAPAEPEVRFDTKDNCENLDVFDLRMDL